jgi:putative phosphoribosyl transferase
MVVYQDRDEAGKRLAERLKQYKNDPNAIVLPLVRGGIEVGAPISILLHVPLFPWFAKKIGHPNNVEFAIGAISQLGSMVVDEDYQELLKTPPMQEHILSIRSTLRKRMQAILGDDLLPDLKNKTVILVDDGIATGRTVEAAIQDIRSKKPKQIILAVGVSPQETLEKFRSVVDAVVCPLIPPPGQFLGAVGAYFKNFDTVTDERVQQLYQKLKGVT